MAGNELIAHKCRVCGGPFFSEPLLHYNNMPKAAQYMPDSDSLAQERGVDLDVRQCACCGLVQLSNTPVPYYREVVRAAAFSAEMKAFRQGQFADFIKRFTLNGAKVFEIGCGRGEYLSLMRAAGAKAHGVEFSAEAVAECRKNGLHVLQGFIDKSDQVLEHSPFDAFFILNFIEHLPDPNAMLRGMSNNLREGAIGLVEAPNFDMILKKRLFSEFIGDHLFYFTRETLTNTLQLNGFEVVDCTVVWHDYIISAVVRKRSRLDVAEFHACEAGLKKEIDDHISRFATNKVAIWGAGHQALAIMSLLELGGKIRYVVDSAPFKQGRYTPATHIPIVSPDNLHTDPVEAVIIMAASYSDEVARTIRERFSAGIHVAILRDYGLQIL